MNAHSSHNVEATGRQIVPYVYIHVLVVLFIGLEYNRAHVLYLERARHGRQLDQHSPINNIRLIILV